MHYINLRLTYLLTDTPCGVSLGHSPAITGTRSTYPRRDGQAKLTMVADYVPRWFFVHTWLPIPVLSGPEVSSN